MAATVWKGHLSVGLVSIPVRIYRAARAEKISFRQLHRASPAEPQELAPEPDAPEPIAARPSRSGAVSAIHQVEHEITLAAPTGPLLAPIRSTPTSAGDSQPIPRSEIVKGYEYQPEQYVLVSDEELRRITPRTASEIQIVEFVHLREIDPVYFEIAERAIPRLAEFCRADCPLPWGEGGR